MFVLDGLVGTRRAIDWDTERERERENEIERE